MDSETKMFKKKTFLHRLEKSPDELKAQHKMMDLLAIRDHSERELSKKLGRLYTKEAVQIAIIQAKINKWLPNTPEEIKTFAEKISQSFLRQGKSPIWIKAKMKAIGLPYLKFQSNEDFQCAMKLAEKFLRSYQRKHRKNQKKDKFQPKVEILLTQFLLNKGIHPDTVKSSSFLKQALANLDTSSVN